MLLLRVAQGAIFVVPVNNYRKPGRSAGERAVRFRYQERGASWVFLFQLWNLKTTIPVVLLLRWIIRSCICHHEGHLKLRKSVGSSQQAAICRVCSYLQQCQRKVGYQECLRPRAVFPAGENSYCSCTITSGKTTLPAKDSCLFKR